MLPTVPPLKLDSSAKVVFDGNSLVAGEGSGGNSLPAVFASLAPAATVVNYGVGGEAWDHMRVNGGAQVDAAYDASKTNVLFLWEHTNTICNGGQTAAQCIAGARTYIAERRAANPGWRIVMLTTLPREASPGITNQATRDACNQAMLDVDAYFLREYRAEGIDAMVWVRRPGSPFLMPDFTTASFVPDIGLFYEGAGNRVHLNGAGYTLIAGLCYETAIRLRKRQTA